MTDLKQAIQGVLDRAYAYISEANEPTLDYEPDRALPIANNLKQEIVTFKTGDDLSFSHWFSEIIHNNPLLLGSKTFPKIDKNTYKASSIDVRWAGLHIWGYLNDSEDDSRHLVVRPGFFWTVLQQSDVLPKTLLIEGYDAYYFWDWIDGLSNDLWEAALLQSIQINPDFINIARIEKPWLFDRPKIQAALANIYMEGNILLDRKSTGKVPDIDKIKYQLYCKVQYHRFTGLSLYAACERVLDDHINQIPEGWKSDPVDSLNKLVKRIDSKYPSLKQPHKDPEK